MTLAKAADKTVQSLIKGGWTQTRVGPSTEISLEVRTKACQINMHTLPLTRR